MSLYNKRGVSAQKEEVHKAVEKLDKGLYANAFCKLYPDYLCDQSDWINVMHADGAGTKSILAYLYWKETGDRSVWKGIAQDAALVNLDITDHQAIVAFCQTNHVDFVVVGPEGPLCRTRSMGASRPLSVA